MFDLVQSLGKRYSSSKDLNYVSFLKTILQQITSDFCRLPILCKSQWIYIWEIFSNLLNYEVRLTTNFCNWLLGICACWCSMETQDNMLDRIVGTFFTHPPPLTRRREGVWSFGRHRIIELHCQGNHSKEQESWLKGKHYLFNPQIPMSCITLSLF